MQNVRMRKPEFRTVKLPELLVDTKQKNLEELEETNLLSYNYAKNTAIDLLKRYIITPWSSEFKDKAFADAVEKHGQDQDGLLRGKGNFEQQLDNQLFIAKAYPSRRYSWDEVLDKVTSTLNNVASDNVEGILREGVRKIDQTYLLVDYLLNHMGKLKNKNVTRINDYYFDTFDPESKKKISLDKKINQLDVPLQGGLFRSINPKNARGFYLAQSLKKGEQGFINDFEEWAMKLYQIKPTGLEEKAEFSGMLSDGTGVRYLFYPESAKRPAGDIYMALANWDPQKEKIVGSTGDLQIIKHLGFKQPYQYKRGGSLLQVETELTDRAGKKGVIKIYRESRKGKRKTTQYPVYSQDGKVYVNVQSVINTIDRLSTKKEPPKTQVKIDFFPKEPDYLNK